MSQIIALDIDDVLADFTGTVRMRVNEMTGADLEREHYGIHGDYWGYYERVWAAHPATEAQTLEPIITEMIEDQMHVPMLAGAAFGISELSKQYHLVCITARPDTLRQSTIKWIERHFAGMDVDVHFTNHSKKDEPTITKGEIAKGLRASYLIDDNVEHCTSALEHGVTPVLFGNYGWQHTIPDGVTRCSDWPSVVEYFSV